MNAELRRRVIAIYKGKLRFFFIIVIRLYAKWQYRTCSIKLYYVASSFPDETSCYDV